MLKNISISEETNSFTLDFVMVGVQRSASTWLFECLKEHPDICLGKSDDKKEINFFDNEDNWNKGKDWYLSKFQKEGKQKCGEICPDYVNSDKAIRRLSECYQNSKIIMVLREPYARSISAYKLFFQLENIPFETLISDHSHDLVKRSLYSDQIKRLQKYFPKKNILFIEYESILNNPQNTISTIFNFLGVDEFFAPQAINNSYNKGVFKKPQKILRLIGLGPLMNVFKQSKLGVFFRKTLVNKKSTKLNIKSLPKNTLNLFQKDILETEALTNMNLSKWKVN